jgi:predicted nucleic acid-binding protein
VLKLRNGRRIVEADALALYADITTLSADVVPFSLPLFDRAWRVARDLGQSDTFDALGYAAAELTGGEFWTSDRRFANAAEARSLPGIVYVP